MLYFLILPLFALAVFAQLALFGASLFSTQLAPLRPYLWRVLVWSSAGFVLANILVTVVCAAPFVFADELGLQDGNPVHEVIGIVAGIGLFIGPVIATIVGLGLGASVGIRRAKRSLAAQRS